MTKEKLKPADGWDCECGLHHPFTLYAQAHWTDTLEHKCSCGRSHKMKAGVVTLIAPTSKQLDGLLEIRAGKVTMINAGYAAFRIHGPVYPSVVGMCIKYGWANWPAGAVGDGKTCEMTDLGNAALAAAGHAIQPDAQ